MTSSGVQHAASSPAWRQFCLWAGLGIAGFAVLFLGLAYVVDPYDTGRSTLFAKAGVRPQGPRTAGASRGRDQAFNAAIIGNSHVQLLSPERLDVAAEKSLPGTRFVSLIAPGTRAREQFVLLDWFMRHHAEAPKALVIGIDEFWCTDDPDLAADQPFPFWLYERNALSYLKGLVRFDILEEVPRRFSYLLARKPKRARPDGYWDYEPGYMQMGYLARAERRAILEEPQSSLLANVTGRFPAMVQLRELMQRLPRQTHVFLVVPPFYHSGLPVRGTAEAQTNMQCKAALAEVAKVRPRTNLLDWRVDNEATRDPALWFDKSHYRRAIAEMIERDIGQALANPR